MAETTDSIRKIKREMGPRLAILAHHYQVDEVFRHADVSGDSLELARRIPELEAEHIVFCGVKFMAESAAILASEGQKIHAPAPEATCAMAAMAPARPLEVILDKLAKEGRRVIPLTYVNSSAAVKAIVGRHGGTVCTSANARTMLDWAMKQGDGVIFLPDRNLAMNTANALEIPPAKRRIIDIRNQGEAFDARSARNAELLIWPGMCIIHHRFKPAHIKAARATHPGALVIVHPECSPEVVELADANGSTSAILRYAAQAPEGAVIYVGTESSMVLRLAEQYAGKKSILPLSPSYCANMGKTTESNLAALLQRIDAAEPVTVNESISAPAREALERMLAICA